MKARILFILFSMLVSLASKAYDFKYTFNGQSINYTIIKDTKNCVVSSGKASGYIPGTKVEGDVEIPELVYYNDEAYKVVGIDRYAFVYCEDLTSLIVPKTINFIGKFALLGCWGLKTLIIEDSEAALGLEDNTFNSLQLDSLYLGRNVDCRSGSCKFADSYPKKITFGEFVTTVNDGLFAYSGISNLIIPASIKNIEEYAFSGCYNLKNLVFENGEHPLTIKKKAFDANKIESFTTGRNWESIDHGLKFSKSLKEVNLVDGITIIPKSAFEGCSELVKVDIPSSVNEIQDYAFVNCYDLSAIRIGDGVKHIGFMAFKSCISATILDLGSNVEIIGGCAFENCSSLEGVDIPSSVSRIGNGTFGRCSNIKSLKVGDGCSYIGPDAFERCSSLSSISLGKNIQEIDQCAFSECTNLESVRIFATHPPKAFSNVFYGGYSATLYVPTGTKEDYLGATESCWPEFCKIIEFNTSGICDIISDEQNKDIDWSLPYQIYNINGQMIIGDINNLRHGIYIVLQKGNIFKVKI